MSKIRARIKGILRDVGMPMKPEEIRDRGQLPFPIEHIEMALRGMLREGEVRMGTRDRFVDRGYKGDWSSHPYKQSRPGPICTKYKKPESSKPYTDKKPKEPWPGDKWNDEAFKKAISTEEKSVPTRQDEIETQLDKITSHMHRSKVKVEDLDMKILVLERMISITAGEVEKVLRETVQLLKALDNE